MLHSACQQIWKTQQWPQDWQSQFSSQFQRRAGLKNVHTTRQLHSLPMLVRLCSEFFKLSFSRLEWRTPRYTSWVPKRQKNQRSNCQHSPDHRESKWIPEKRLLLFHWLHESLCVNHSKLWKILKEMGIPDYLTCLLRNLYVGQEAILRTLEGTTDKFQIGKEYVRAVYCHPV